MESGRLAYVGLFEERLAAAMLCFVGGLRRPWHEGIIPRVFVHVEEDYGGVIVVASLTLDVGARVRLW